MLPINTNDALHFVQHILMYLQVNAFKDGFIAHADVEVFNFEHD